jgi:hypothetical protein
MMESGPSHLYVVPNIPEKHSLCGQEKKRKGEVGPQNPPCKERDTGIVEVHHLGRTMRPGRVMRVDEIQTHGAKP